MMEQPISCAKKAKFKVDKIPGEYTGYYLDSPADTWNGHPVPWFTSKEMWRMVDNQTTPILVHSDLFDDFLEEVDGQGRLFVVREILMTVDGRLPLYSPGNQSWFWEII